MFYQIQKKRPLSKLKKKIVLESQLGGWGWG
uniref:Uncharacterized protein n=1 Tax=Arundo donax TaxID=35708 RepID=A0A0A9HIP9_ARUDO